MTTILGNTWSNPLGSHLIPTAGSLAPEHCSSPQLPAYAVQEGRCVWHWHDEETLAQGWIVIDAPVPTLAGGGLFMHVNATLEEVTDVACAMSQKLAVSAQPQVVGAKGGIRFDQHDRRAPEVLERFIRDNVAVISQYWGTGADLNTSHDVIDRHCRKYGAPGTLTALDALPRNLDPHGLPSRHSEALLEEHIDEVGWPLRDFSVGFGMAIALEQLLKRTNPELLGKARLVLQGFGCVGATFAQSVKSLSIGRVVAISSPYGFFVNEKGIDCQAIHTRRQLAAARGELGQYDSSCLEAGLTAAELASDSYTRRDDDATDEEDLVRMLASVKAEVFVPCAKRYTITPNVLATMVQDTFAGVPNNARYILAGANNVFDKTLSWSHWMSRLDAGFIKMLPEWVSNSGTSNLFMRFSSGLVLQGRAINSLESIAKDTKSFIHMVFTRLQGSNITASSLAENAEAVATSRRTGGVVNMLGVDSLSEFTLVTADAKRAVTTFTQIIGATPVQESSSNYFQLPGSGDPTLRIIQAPSGADFSVLGLTAHFSVCNLDKAREVLTAQRIPFREQPISGGSGTDLVLTGPEAGYRMTFRQLAKSQWPPFRAAAQHKQVETFAGRINQIDHYAPMTHNVEDSLAFHERFMGFTSLYSIVLNFGAAPEGEKDSRIDIVALPFDELRVTALAEGLVPGSIVQKMIDGKDGVEYIHHIAFQTDDVEAAFTAVRDRGWKTTADHTTLDAATGLRQFFFQEEEAGCVLELIQRRPVVSATDPALGTQQSSSDADEKAVDSVNRQGVFLEENILELSKGLEAFIK